MMAGGGLGQPPTAAAAPGLWQAGDPGFIRPIANVGLQVPGVIQIAAQAIPPPLAVNTGHIYSFNVAGVSELHYLDSAGVVTQLTGAGGILFHSLQNAYDDGVVIATTGPLGAITFNNIIADNSNVLDITRTNVVAGGRGVTITMPVAYAVGDIVGLEITGDAREVEICNNAYAIQVVAGDIFLADTLEIQFTNATQLIRGNGVDMEFTNTSLLGDILYNATVLHRFEIAGNPEYEMSATEFNTLGNNIRLSATATIQWSGAHITIQNDTQRIILDAQTDIFFQQNAANRLEIDTTVHFHVRMHPEVTSALDMGDATHIWQKVWVESIGMYDVTGNDFTTMWQMPALTTPAAAITTMETITLEDNHRYAIEIWVVSMQDDGTEGNYYHLDALFKREGGGAVQEGATTSITTIEEAGAADCVFDVNGNDVRVRVTGIVAEDWHWTGKIQVVEVD